MEFSKITDLYNDNKMPLDMYIKNIGKELGQNINYGSAFWFAKDIIEKNKQARPITLFKIENTYKFVCDDKELFKVEKTAPNKFNSNESLLRTSLLVPTDDSGLASTISNDQYIVGTNGLYETMDKSFNKYRYITFNSSIKLYYEAYIDKEKGKVIKNFYDKNGDIESKYIYTIKENKKFKQPLANVNDYISKFISEEFPELNSYEFNRTVADALDQYFYDIRLIDRKDKYNDLYITNKSKMICESTDLENTSSISIKGTYNKNKEDCFAISNPTIPEIKLLCVTDFINGSKLDESLSKYITLSFEKWFYSLNGSILKDENQLLAHLEKKIKNINKAINTQIKSVNKKKQNIKKQFGSSLGLCLITKDSTYFVNYGDTRIYANNDKKLTPLTIDNTSVWDLYRNGDLTFDEATNYQKGAILTDYIGKESNLFKLPDIYQLDNNYESLYVVSDGVTDNLNKQTMDSIVAVNKKQDILKEMIIQSYKNQTRHDDISGCCYIKK